MKNALTWSEQMAVIQAMPKKYQLIFLFLACHGKRISEALSLKWEDIDFKTKSFRIYESKVKKESRLPLHEEFFNTLPFAGAINKTGPFFPVCSDDSLNRVLKTACAKAGVKKVTTHEFGRHSFVSQLLPHFTKEQVALITNNLSSVSRYAHMDLEQKRRIINSNRSLT